MMESPKRGYLWRIANLSYFNAYEGYFALGRTTQENLPRFDEDTGEFIQVESETSPYTHCVFDSQIGIVAIAKKVNLAPSTKSIASRLQDILGKTSIVLENEVQVEIAPIPDPDGFLKTINSAYRVSRFSANFTGPNPFDADEFSKSRYQCIFPMQTGKEGRQ